MIINYFSNMNPITGLSICVGLFVINMISAIIARVYVQKFFDCEQKVDEALNKLRMINQYIKSFLLILTTLVASLSMHSVFKSFGEFGKLITLLFPFLFMTLCLLGDQLVYHDFIKRIRNTSETKYEKITSYLRYFGIIFIPIIIIKIIDIYFWEDISKIVNPNSLLSMVMPIIPIIIIYLLMPIFYKAMYKKSKLQDLKIYDDIMSFLERQNLKNVDIYQFEASKSKIANAIVSGYFKKYIMLSDYLIENFELEEIKAVLAHEICHIKKLHLWIRFFVVIFGYFLVMIMGTVMDNYEAFFNQKIPKILGILIFLVVIVFYYRIAMFLLIRKQELEADRYVLKMGINSDTMISALEKLAKLNDSVTSYGKFDQLFLTHPSYKIRIEKIKFWGNYENM